LWIDAETYSGNYKVIHDRSGGYWRTFFKADSLFISKDMKTKLHNIAMEMMVCDRTDHATVHLGLGPNVIGYFYAQVDLNDFSLAGFQALCK
jgi:hypothetical protein